uniref:U-actitoxin-Avd12a-like isoform X1 n=2 Tax=Myxine glutinosa TaxID=7769 RepID=UPI00358E4E7C
MALLVMRLVCAVMAVTVTLCTEDPPVTNCKPGTPCTSTRQVVQTSAANTEECPIEKKDFCLNGGTCYYYPHLDHLMCLCASHYSGQRCGKHILEFNGASHQNVLLIVVPVTAVLVAAFIILISFYRCKKQQPDETETEEALV